MTANTGLFKVAVGVAGGMSDVAPGTGVAFGAGVGDGTGRPTWASSGVGVEQATTIIESMTM